MVGACLSSQHSGRQRQTDLCEFKDSMIYRVSFRTAQDTQRNPFFKNKTKQHKKKRQEKEKRRRSKKKNCNLVPLSHPLALKSSQTELETRVSFITGMPETLG